MTDLQQQMEEDRAATSEFDDENKFGADERHEAAREPKLVKTGTWTTVSEGEYDTEEDFQKGRYV